MGPLLALASAVSYGLADYVGGLLARRADPVAVAMIGQVVSLLITAVAAPVIGADVVRAGDLWWGALSGVGTGLGMAFLYRGLARGDMSVVVPISAVASVALSVLVGVLLLGDRPSAPAWLGIVIAIPALWLVCHVRSTAHRPRVPRGASDGFLASVGIAVQYLALSQADPAAGIWPVATGRVTATIAMVGFAVGVATRFGMPGVVALRSTGIGLLTAVALVCYLFSTHDQEVAIAVVLASLYPVLPVLLGLTVLREKVSASQAVGLVAAGCAIPLLAVG